MKITVILDMQLESRMKEIEVYENINEQDPEDLESIEDIAAAYDQIGHLYAEEGETETAKHYYEKGIETYEKLIESDPGNVDYEIGIADSLDFIGELYKSLEPETARSYFEKALAINEKVVKLFPESTDYKEDLIYTLKNLTSLSAEQNQHENAIQLFERITELRQGNGPGKSRENLSMKKPWGIPMVNSVSFSKKSISQNLQNSSIQKQVMSSGISCKMKEDPTVKQILSLELQMQVALFIHIKKASHCKRIPRPYP